MQLMIGITSHEEMDEHLTPPTSLPAGGELSVPFGAIGRYVGDLAEYGAQAALGHVGRVRRDQALDGHRNSARDMGATLKPRLRRGEGTGSTG
jgi:hypothetical protein